jgi:MFS family permease
MFLVLMPVYVPYMTQLGLTMEQIYTVQSLFAFGVLIFEIPSGYISDLWGRRESLILGCLFHAIGLTLFAFSENIYVFYCAELILAFGSSLISGTDISLIYESNEAIGQKSSSIKDIGKIMFYRNTGEAIAALLGGWLFTFYFKGPVIALAITGWFPFFLSFLLVEPPKKVKLSKEHKQNFKLVYQALFKHSKLLNLILLNGIFYSVSTLLAVWSFQVYWKEIGISKDYFGYLWFIMNLVVALFARWAPLVEKRLGSTKVLLLVGLLPIICFGFMGFIKGLVGVVFAFLFQVVRAIN